MFSLPKKYQVLLHALFFSLLSTGYAQQSTPNVGAFEVNKQTNFEDSNSILQEIKQELLNLGYFFGYPIDSNKTPQLDQSFQNNINNIINIQGSTIKQFISILSANVFQPSFVPTNDNSNNPYSALNDLANTVLTNNQVYNQQLDAPLQKASGSNNVRMSPVSQMVLNILSFTPDDICWVSASSGRKQDWNSSCNYSFTTSILYANALGFNFSNDNLAKSNSLLGAASAYNSLADASKFNIEQYFPQGQQNPQSNVLSQVDSSIFLSPLVYNSQSSGTSDNKPPLSGLDTSTQINAAESFLRNVTGTILPPTVANKKDIEKIQTSISSAKDIASQLSAFKNLGSYVLGTRVYAARESVALQNIYEIMSKRMPYTPSSGSSSTQSSSNSVVPGPQTPSSQALNEFIMASYRLYNPGASQGQTTDSQGQTQWQNMIATASSQNVEREIALLLAELNYQMYLMRQQQERIVLTNSLLLLNNLQYPTLQND